MEQIKVLVKNKKKVVVEIPLDLLKHIAENMPDFSFKIKNKEELGRYFIGRFIDTFDEEDLFFKAVDNCIISAYEDGEEFIINQDDEE